MGIVLELVGARAVKEGTGRVVRYELIPLDEMRGRPRIDVLCNMSGIFRDSFANVVGLLDDLFQRAAGAVGEDPQRNFICKHAMEMEAAGIDNASARLFSNPPVGGDARATHQGTTHLYSSTCGIASRGAHSFDLSDLKESVRVFKVWCPTRIL